MKIAIFHELPNGGARRAVNEFAKRLKINHDVDLYIIDDATTTAEKKFYTHFYFYPFIPQPWKGGNWRLKLYKDTIELYRLYKLHKNVAKDINSRKYDLVFINPSKYTQAPYVIRFIKVKKCYYCQEPLRMIYDPIFNKLPNSMNFMKKTYEKITRFLRKRIDKQNVAYADLVLANSRYSQENINNAYKLRSFVSYLGVDINVFKPLIIKKDIDILYIGSRETFDGYTLLNEAVEFMKVKPKIYRHIPGENWIEDDKAFAKLYSRAKIVVCLSNNEPFGLIPLESMACGVPVVAVNEGGYNESVIDNKTGLLITRDPKDLAKKLDYLLLSPGNTEKMGIAGRKYVTANWNWDKRTLELEQTFYKLIN